MEKGYGTPEIEHGIILSPYQLNSDEKFADITDSAASINIATSEASPPPDGGLTAWLTVVASFMNHFISIGILYSYGIYQRYYKMVEFSERATNFEISFVGTISLAFMLALGTFVGAMCDGNLGYQKTATLGMIVLPSSLILASFCTELWQLYLTQGFLLGLGAALCFFPAVSIPSQWFLRRRASATGIAVAGSGVGGIVWSVISDYMINAIGFRWSLRVTGLASFAILVVSTLLLKARIPPKKRDKLFDLSIFKNPIFIILFFSSIFAQFSYAIPFVYLPLYCDYVGFDSSVGATMLGITNGASVFGRVIMGVLADRIGVVNSYIICLAGSGIGTLSFWLFGGSVPMVAILSVLNGFFSGGFISLVPVVSAHLFGIEGLATIVGFVYTGAAVPNLAGPPIAGNLIDMDIPSPLSSGRYSYPIIFAGLGMVVGAALAIYLRLVVRRRKSPAEGSETDVLDN